MFHLSYEATQHTLALTFSFLRYAYIFFISLSNNSIHCLCRNSLHRVWMCVYVCVCINMLKVKYFSNSMHINSKNVLHFSILQKRMMNIWKKTDMYACYFFSYFVMLSPINQVYNKNVENWISINKLFQCKEYQLRTIFPWIILCFANSLTHTQSMAQKNVCCCCFFNGVWKVRKDTSDKAE